jgi:hypothetical protein
MSYRTFYDAFLARYLPCYACEPAERAMQMLDLDHSGSISWTELRLRACWALAQAGGGMATLQQLVDVVFHVFLLPDMRAAMAKTSTQRRLKGVVARVAFTAKLGALGAGGGGGGGGPGPGAATPDSARSASTEFKAGRRGSEGGGSAIAKMCVEAAGGEEAGPISLVV